MPLVAAFTCTDLQPRIDGTTLARLQPAQEGHPENAAIREGGKPSGDLSILFGPGKADAADIALGATYTLSLTRLAPSAT